MSVTINTLGANSRQIVIDGEVSATNIISAVDTSLTALGWTIYDTVTSGTRGLLTTKVYSAPNADTVTTKYMIIRFDLHRQYWVVSCCESWNTSTNVATNESWYGGRHIILPLQYSNCILYVFANVRYACFIGVVRGEPSAWQGVFEFERSASEDIAANTVPCFAWTSSLTIGEPYGAFSATASSGSTSANSGQVACGIAPPRTASGNTGLAAAAEFVIMTGLGAYPPQKSFLANDWSSGGITQATNSHCGMLGSFSDAMSDFVWSPQNTIINNLKLAGYNQFYKIGKIYGLKITVKLGAPLLTTIIPVDANLFFDSSGTPTNHIILGINGGYKDKLSTGTNKLTYYIYTAPSSLGNLVQSVFVSGRYLYFATSSGFHKYDFTSSFYTLNVLPAAAYTAVKFDGLNSLYISSGTTTVYKLNLTNDTYTTYTSSVAISGIALDDDNLYAASNVSGTTAVVKKVSLSTFTETASWTITIGTSASTISHINTADYAGYVYVAGLILQTRNAGRIVKIQASDGTTSSLTPAIATAAGGANGQPMHFDGEWLWLISCGMAMGINNVLAAKIRISNFTLTAEIQLSSSLGLNYFTTVPTTQACFEIPSFGGFQHYFSSTTSTAVRVTYSDPRFPSGLTVISADNNVLDSANTTCQGYATDHCSLYTFTSTSIIKYTGAYRNYNFNGAQASNLLIPQ